LSEGRAPVSGARCAGPGATSFLAADVEALEVVEPGEADLTLGSHENGPKTIAKAARVAQQM